MENSLILSDDSGIELREKFHLAVQVIGVVLVLLGVIFAVQVLWKVWAIVNNPSILSAKIGQFKQILNAGQMAISIQGHEIKVGSAISMLILILWYHLLIWIPIAIINVGARVASAGSADRTIARSMQKAVLELKKKGIRQAD